MSLKYNINNDKQTITLIIIQVDNNKQYTTNKIIAFFVLLSDEN